MSSLPVSQQHLVYRDSRKDTDVVDAAQTRVIRSCRSLLSNAHVLEGARLLRMPAVELGLVCQIGSARGTSPS